MLSERKKLMDEVHTRISQEFNRLKSKTGLDSNLMGPIFDMFNRRVADAGVRSYFVYALSFYINKLSALEGRELKNRPRILFNTQLPLVAEGIITVQYLENQLLDGKDQTRICDEDIQKQRRDQKLLASHFLKDFLYNYIETNILPDDPEAERLVARAVRRIFQFVDLGQMMQDEWGTYKWFRQGHKNDISISPEIDTFIENPLIRKYWKVIEKEGLDSQHISFMRNYLRRVYLTSGALFVLMAELEMDLLGYNGEERNNIKSAAAAIGIIGQVVNDICDFVPHRTTAKREEDVLSDIRNDIISLPLALFFDQNSEIDLNSLQNLAYNALARLSLSNKDWLSSTAGMQKIAPALLSSIKIAEELRECSCIFFNKYIQEGILMEDLNSVADHEQNRILKDLMPQLEVLTLQNESNESSVKSLHFHYL